MLEDLLAVIFLLMTKVSFTFLSNNIGGLEKVLMTLISNSSMNRLAMIGLKGNP